MTKTIIAAISGGIDSVVMLDKLVKSENKEQIVVAHFNHGIRHDSDLDERFVGNLAKSYGLRFETKKENLGPDASENYARARRYHFLKDVAARYGGEIYTAHHADDLVESVIINLLRGTGWRGLVPLDNAAINRPLLSASKTDIKKYALENGLAWREDSTNLSDDYLRNRVRKRLEPLEKDKKDQVLKLYERQKKLKFEIEHSIRQLLPADGLYERSWFNGDDQFCIEFLRLALEDCEIKATRPQLRNFLLAIRTYESGKLFNLPNDKLVKLGKTSFYLTKTSLK